MTVPSAVSFPLGEAGADDPLDATRMSSYATAFAFRGDDSRLRSRFLPLADPLRAALGSGSVLPLDGGVDRVRLRPARFISASNMRWDGSWQPCWWCWDSAAGCTMCSLWLPEQVSDQIAARSAFGFATSAGRFLATRRHHVSGGLGRGKDADHRGAGRAYRAVLSGGNLLVTLGSGNQRGRNFPGESVSDALQPRQHGCRR